MGRIDKVNQQVKREIGRIIQQELEDPRIQFVMITGADVSRDLRNGKIHFSVLGEESQVRAARPSRLSFSVTSWCARATSCATSPT